MSLLQDFKAFAFKGNVIDMAVGVVVGGAFQKIVSGLVSNVIMPLVGVALPAGDWRTAGITLREAEGDNAALKLTYGALIGDVLDFLIVAIVLFLVVARLIPLLMKKKKEEEAAPAAPPEPTKEEALLGEIRDLLKAQAAK